MCFGHDGDASARALARREGRQPPRTAAGRRRRCCRCRGARRDEPPLLRRSKPARAATAHGRGHGHGRREQVPHDTRQHPALHAPLGRGEPRARPRRPPSATWPRCRPSRATATSGSSWPGSTARRPQGCGRRSTASGCGPRRATTASAPTPARRTPSSRTPGPSGQGYVNVPFLNSPSLADWQRWADQMNAEAAHREGLRPAGTATTTTRTSSRSTSAAASRRGRS